MKWPLDSSEHVWLLRTPVGAITSLEVRKKMDVVLQVKTILLDCGERRKILDLGRNWLSCRDSSAGLRCPGKSVGHVPTPQRCFFISMFCHSVFLDS